MRLRNGGKGEASPSLFPRFAPNTHTQQTHDVTPTSGIRRLNVTSGKHVVTTLCSRNFTTLYHDVYHGW
jgi:hypothetical protein